LLIFGNILDRLLARISHNGASVGEAAIAYHQLHQVLTRDPNPVTKNNDDDDTASMHACLYAVNLAEAAGSEMNQEELFRIYLASAIHCERQRNWLMTLLASFYLIKARSVLPHCGDRARIHSWVFTPTGRQFFKSQSWIAHTFTIWDGSRLIAGSVEHLSYAYRARMLQTAFSDFNAGGDIPRTLERLQEVRQISISAVVRVLIVHS
jgi:hypothetical protein